jgi:hypothetical protein
MKRKAQRAILASFGEALEAFSARWEELDARHRLERERFERWEGNFAGRVMNAARAMPLTLCRRHRRAIAPCIRTAIYQQVP